MVNGGIVVQFAVIIGAVLGLGIGARTLVDAAVKLAQRFGVSEITIALTVVAVGTSTPELVVTSDAALSGLGDIAVGNVVGSNIYNLAFILGVVSLLRVIPVERSLLHRDGIALVLATFVGFAVLFDRTVTRGEGIALVGLLVGYTIYLIRDERAPPPIDTEYPESRVSETVAESVSLPGRDVLLLLGGLATVLISGHYLVEAASALARYAGVSDWVIGGTIVSAGTSTPEFAVSLLALRRGHIGMSVGNVVGSNIFNVLGILGVAAIVRPLSVGGAAIEGLLWLTVITVVMVGALWSGRRLSRLEGGLFALSEAVRWIAGLFRVFG
ncbi:sodium:calcium antiporter [Halobellus limi]|uniref:Cation:H+ antiporter n=1 Tax=Halobellus limi TaxID=699433 RepID=A0A1H5TBM2_9EURY|nr:sodium:calcium antiporter [Halobellus limi]QCC47352.1 sodium:calcium antiporter [Halobellus limi]SEF60186.1 cation:H+ antiporter [Halobellus limi]